MPQIADHLLILKLDSCESKAQLTDAYQLEILKWHPDRFHCDPVMQPKATKHATKINAAFEYLSELLERDPLPCSTPRANTTSTSNPQQAYRTQHTYNRKPFTPGFGDPNVFEVFVKSSHIISIGYDHTKGTLYIKLEGDYVYAYLHVPETVFSDFLAAESHGKFAHRYIYRQYEYENVRYKPKA